MTLNAPLDGEYLADKNPALFVFVYPPRSMESDVE